MYIVTLISGSQANLGDECPSHLFSAAYMSITGAIQATLFALFIERDWKQWKLGWDVRLFTVSYAVCHNFWES